MPSPADGHTMLGRNLSSFDVHAGEPVLPTGEDCLETIARYDARQHMTLSCGWYSNRKRGERRKAEVDGKLAAAELQV